MAKILGILGGVTTSTSTLYLTEYILNQLQNATNLDTELLDLAEITNSLDEYYFLENIMSADVIVISSAIPPLVKSSVYKHFFDCINPKLLVGKTILLTLTGSSLQQLIVLENQLRPLLTMFGAKTLPTTIFAQDSDFLSNALINLLVKDQIGVAVVQTLQLMKEHGLLTLTTADK